MATPSLVIGSGDHFMWDHILTDKLIELWFDSPLLYDSTSIEYRDKFKRDLAVAAIASELGTTEADVRDKMKTLRSQYARERAHEEKSQAAALIAGGGRDPYRSKWFYFAKLSFLDEFRRRSKAARGLTVTAMHRASNGYLSDLPVAAIKSEASTDGSLEGEPSESDAVMAVTGDASYSLTDSLVAAPDRLGRLNGARFGVSGGVPADELGPVGGRSTSLRLPPGISDAAPACESDEYWLPLSPQLQSNSCDHPLSAPFGRPGKSKRRRVEMTSPVAAERTQREGGVELLAQLISQAVRCAAEDSEEVFGRFVANELRQLKSVRDRRIAKLRVHQALAAVAYSDEHDSVSP